MGSLLKNEWIVTGNIFIILYFRRLSRARGKNTGRRSKTIPASLLSGATITETVFAIGGIGRLTVDALRNRDIPLLQGSLIFSTALIIVGNIVADIMYTFLDPRVRV